VSSLLSHGTVFLDKKAVSIQGIKPKYFLGMNDVDDEDDKIVAFVFNTENNPGKYKDGCNFDHERFLFSDNLFSFQSRPTSLMLNRTYFYKCIEVLGNDIKILETIDEIVARQVKNCINKENIEEFAWELINKSFKIKKN
jgi:hypothetical protein